MLPSLLLASLVALSVGAQGADPVIAEFRVFDGAVEVTESTLVRVWPAGRRDVEPVTTGGTAISLPPGIYDLEARRSDRSGVVAIEWVERVAVLHYPDEGGHHLHVINFQPEYGALQLRTVADRRDAYTVALFRSGNRAVPAAQPAAGSTYVLFVVPAGRYDVRVQHAEHGGAPDTHWLIGVDVPPGGTRLKLVVSAAG